MVEQKKLLTDHRNKVKRENLNYVNYVYMILWRGYLGELNSLYNRLQ